MTTLRHWLELCHAIRIYFRYFTYWWCRFDDDAIDNSAFILWFRLTFRYALFFAILLLIDTPCAILICGQRAERDICYARCAMIIDIWFVVRPIFEYTHHITPPPSWLSFPCHSVRDTTLLQYYWFDYADAADIITPLMAISFCVDWPDAMPLMMILAAAIIDAFDDADVSIAIALLRHFAADARCRQLILTLITPIIAIHRFTFILSHYISQILILIIDIYLLRLYLFSLRCHFASIEPLAELTLLIRLHYITHYGCHIDAWYLFHLAYLIMSPLISYITADARFIFYRHAFYQKPRAIFETAIFAWYCRHYFWWLRHLLWLLCRMPADATITITITLATLTFWCLRHFISLRRHSISCHLFFFFFFFFDFHWYIIFIIFIIIIHIWLH